MKFRNTSPKKTYSVQHKTSLSPEQREAKLAAQARRRRLSSLAWKGAGILLVVLVIIFLARTTTSAQPGDKVTDMGNTHIGEIPTGNEINYTSKPPTSGPHVGVLAPWGVNEQPIPDAVQIHNLEDGGVGIWYNCPEGCPDLVEQLTGVVEDMGAERLLLAPYPDMDSTIAITAWNRIDKFEDFDQRRIKSFIAAYRGIDHHRR